MVRSRLIAAIAATLLPVATISAQLTAVGAVNPVHGFPSSYTDAGATALQPCLSNTGFCLLAAAVNLLNPGAPFPQNFGGTFPDEFLYWAGDATMTTNGGGQALLVMALTGSFANGLVVPGDQVVFGRIRLRIDNLQVGSNYRITTPYGVFNIVPTVAGRRSINFTQDIGIATPGVFTTALNSGIGPFLRWDSGLPIVDVAGNQFIGDPNIEHTVTGSPTGTNFFRIEGPNVGGPGINAIQTNLFSVVGMVNPVAAPVANFTATPTTGNAPLNVAFTSTSTGTITSFAWTFGDGGTSTLQNPTHIYTTSGSRTVSLTVTGPGGSNTRTAANFINVGVAAPPTFAIASITPGVAGQNNRFTITGVTPNQDVFVLWSRTAGTAPITLRNCNIISDLAAPQNLFSGRSGGTTLTRDVSINGALRGVTLRLQAVDTGRCAKSPVFVELF
jgi:PKD repeat protein